MAERNGATSANAHGLAPAQARAREEQRTRHLRSRMARLFIGTRP